MTRKHVFYDVQCTKAVAIEMCRYEGSEIVQEELVKAAPKKLLLSASSDWWSVYRFTIKARYCVEARWKSFGVVPVMRLLDTEA